MISIEVPLLLSFFSFMLTSSVNTNLVIYRTCYTILGYNHSECALLGNTNNNITQRLEKLVEPDANIVKMVKSMVEAVLAVVVCVFIAPWSDKFGRRPVLLASQIGFGLSTMMVSIYCIFDSLSPWYLIICSLPMIVTGGGATFVTVVISYLADITTEESRGIRMAIFEAVLTTGSLLGTFSSSYIFYATSYEAIFAISTGCHLLSYLHTWFFVSESVQNVEPENGLRTFFNLANIRAMFSVAAKRRDQYKREIICMSVAILSVYSFVSNAGMMSFQFLRAKFGWTLSQFTLFSTIDSIVWTVCSLVATYILHTLLKITDSVLIFVGAVSMFCNSLVLAVAWSNTVIYATPVIRVLGGLMMPMVRTMVSKCVSSDEVGKTFSLINFSEYLFALGAAPLYTYVYNKTINIDPGIFNYLSAVLFGFILIVTGFIIPMQLNMYRQLTQEGM